MGYLVFIEKLTPIFEFKKMAKKYQNLNKTTYKPYENYNWIIGDDKV
jgi:hypothetical protein